MVDKTMNRRVELPQLDRIGKVSAIQFTLWIVVGAIIISSIYNVSPSPQRVAEGVPRLGSLMNRMFPPETDPEFLGRVFWRLVETMQIAIAGTVLGVLISLPIGWLSARGIAPLKATTFLFKALISFFRTVPDLIWALIFVITVGLGAVAGTMTIMVDTIGFCGGFFGEAMEDADKEPQEALEAIGASKFSILCGAVIPDAMPSLINTTLFALEKAVRSSVVLGLVGAGGIGQELKSSFDLFQYKKAAAIMLAIFLIVLIMEWVTDRLRRSIT
ncbi:phosphonate ABC transporter, permease protein PhnE [Maritalea sp. S77]|uniref:phosphonate ABC transporter, permease protein PhnE n=1 Tax=Maritalea sp. S77 TaxID=3415125 RepID=UPI003C7AFB5F